MWIKLNGASGTGKSTLSKSVAFRLNSIPQSLSIQEQKILHKYEKEFNTILKENESRSVTYIANLISSNKYFDVTKNNNNEILNLFNVSEYNLHLSEGEAQRFNFQEALATGPDLLIMDECLSGLPEPFEFEILIFLKKNLSNINLLYISHRRNADIDELFEMELSL
jgi:ABC-type molybdate transport system ATPase subunit